jgi:hypothetical protein
MLHVGDNRIANFLSHGQPRLTPPFSGNINPGLLPVDVAPGRCKGFFVKRGVKIDILGPRLRRCKWSSEPGLPAELNVLIAGPFPVASGR